MWEASYFPSLGYRLSNRTANPSWKVLDQADDSDVLFLLLHHSTRLKPLELYQDLGLSSRNNRRTISVSIMAQQLGTMVLFLSNQNV